MVQQKLLVYKLSLNHRVTYAFSWLQSASTMQVPYALCHPSFLSFPLFWAQELWHRHHARLLVHHKTSQPRGGQGFGIHRRPQCSAAVATKKRCSHKDMKNNPQKQPQRCGQSFFVSRSSCACLSCWSSSMDTSWQSSQPH